MPRIRILAADLGFEAAREGEATGACRVGERARVLKRKRANRSL